MASTTLPSQLKLSLEALIRLFYPSLCGSCRKLLNLDETGICDACFEKLSYAEKPLLDSAIEEDFHFLDNAWSLYTYQSPLKEILKHIKFSGERWLLKVFQTPLKTRLLALHGENHYDALIPIPLDRQKRVDRQYNQAALMAQLVAKQVGIPCLKSILIKKHKTPAQSHLGKQERLINLRGAYQVKKSISGKSYLLIDDILTTGATGEEAARTLKLGGAKKVDILTIAYAKKGSKKK